MEDLFPVARERDSSITLRSTRNDIINYKLYEIHASQMALPFDFGGGYRAWLVFIDKVGAEAVN